MQKNSYQNALGLDIGEKRIGLARINSVARLPEPLKTIANDSGFLEKLKAVIDEHSIDLLVVGLPRNMSGQETAQSEAVKSFVETVIKPIINLPIVFQDETLSSVEAEAFSKDLINEKGLDAIAAANILQYFAKENE